MVIKPSQTPTSKQMTNRDKQSTVDVIKEKMEKDSLVKLSKRK
jgi:hypothetical protein